MYIWPGHIRYQESTHLTKTRPACAVSTGALHSFIWTLRPRSRGSSFGLNDNIVAILFTHNLLFFLVELETGAPPARSQEPGARHWESEMEMEMEVEYSQWHRHRDPNQVRVRVRVGVL